MCDRGVNYHLLGVFLDVRGSSRHYMGPMKALFMYHLVAIWVTKFGLKFDTWLRFENWISSAGEKQLSRRHRNVFWYHTGIAPYHTGPRHLSFCSLYAYTKIKSRRSTYGVADWTKKSILFVPIYLSSRPVARNSFRENRKQILQTICNILYILVL